MTFFFGFLVCLRSHGTATSTASSLSLRLDPTGREFPSPLVTVFDVPVASMRASGVKRCDAEGSTLAVIALPAAAAGSCTRHTPVHQSSRSETPAWPVQRKHDSTSPPRRGMQRAAVRGRARGARQARAAQHVQKGSGVGESDTYAFATLARSDHCSPCPCPAPRWIRCLLSSEEAQPTA
jgi:hypothetical protein